MRSYLKHVLITSLFLPVVTIASAQVVFTPIEQQFDARAVSELIVDAPNANITINTSNRSDIAVQVVVTGKNQERVDDYYESQYFDLTLEEGALQLRSEPDWVKLDRRWWRTPPTIDVAVAMPPTVYSELLTRTGDILVNELNAGAEIRTINGKIAVDSISGGPISLISSGHITAKELRGSTVNAITINGNFAVNLLQSEDMEIRTLDGSILVKNVTSRGEIILQTSSGNIIADHITGEYVTAKSTNKGDIEAGLISGRTDMHVRNGAVQIRQITGSLMLDSSNGDVEVGVADAQHIRINASNGDVTLSASENFSATLDLAGKNLDLSGWGLSNPGTESKLRIATQEGGPLIHVRATNGDIVLAPLKNYNISSTRAVPPPVP